MSWRHESPEPLPGGLANAGRVTRVGDAVRRPAPEHARSIHPLLRHLHAAGFAAPHPRDVDTNGFELVDFVPGDVAVNPYPAWANNDRTLASVGQLVRRYHEAVGDFVVPADAAWSGELADPEGGSIVCHNDVCIENVVFRDGGAVGLLDFDFASPGRPVWDLVHAARYWVPLTDPELVIRTRGRVDPVARLRVIVDAYGLDESSRRLVPDVIVEAERVALHFFTGRAERGDPAFVWDSAAQRRFDQKMSWLHAHLAELAAAIR